MTRMLSRRRADRQHNTSLRTADGRSMADGTHLSRPMDRMVRLTGEAALASLNTQGASHHATTRDTKEIA